MKEQEEKVVYKTSPKVNFAMGALAGITVTSLAAFIMSFSLLRANDTVVDNQGKVAGEEVVVNTNTAQPSPTAAPTPSPAPTKADVAIKDTDHIKGDKNAPVTLVEYSDFECPFCGRVQPTLEQVLDEYKGQVKLIFRHYPLSFHPNARKAAEASECAAEQGRFWEMHDKMFENQQALSVDNLKDYAKELGLNTSNFDKCLDDGKYAQKIQDDIAEGSQYGVQGTPATFVNGELISGAQPYDNFKSVIDSLLK